MGKTFAPKRGAKIRGFVVHLADLDDVFIFVVKPLPLLSKWGVVKTPLFWGGNKRDGGMLLNFGIGNIMIVFFLAIIYIYIIQYIDIYM